MSPLCSFLLCGIVPVGPALSASSRAAGRAQGLRGVGLGSLWGKCAAKKHGAGRFAMFWFSAPHYRGGTTKIDHFWGHFYTFWTRVAITAPRRPRRTKLGFKAVWVLGNQPVAGVARRFGRLARAPACTRWCPLVPVSRPKKFPWGAMLYLAPATLRSQYSRANDALGL